MSDIENVPAPKPKRAAPKKPAAKKSSLAKTKAKKAAVMKKATKAAQRAAPEEFPLDAKIYLLVDECPRRPGTPGAKHWTRYKNGLTVQRFLDEGGERSRLRTDLARGSLELRR